MATYKSIAYDQFISNGGSQVLLAETTASSSATVSFTSGINSTYKEYLFRFIDIHPSADGANLTIQASTDSGSSYGIAITSTYFRALANEGDSDAGLSYSVGDDLHQSTAYQELMNTGNDNDQSGAGWLRLFNPSSTTFVKHFISTTSNVTLDNYERNIFAAGYFNTTSALDAIQFKMDSGNIDAGTIKMYGIN